MANADEFAKALDLLTVAHGTWLAAKQEVDLISGKVDAAKADYDKAKVYFHSLVDQVDKDTALE